MAKAHPLALVLLAPALSGCLGAETGSADAIDVPLPTLGATATYHVTGTMVDFLRWNNGQALAGLAEITFDVKASPPALDGYRVRHEGYRVDVLHATDKIRELHVDMDHNALVQSWSPINNAEKVLAFDERGYPWAWGASLLQGARLRVGDEVSFELPGNAGDGPPEAKGLGAPLPLSLRVAAAEADGTFRLELHGNSSVDWTLWMRDGNPWPERAHVEWRAAGLAPYLRAQNGDDFEMTATLQAQTEGAKRVPFGDRSASWVTEPMGGERLPWNGEAPPDGSEPYAPFLLGEAVSFAKTLDAGLQDFLQANAEALLSRATYFKRAGDAPGTTVHSWLLQYVSRTGEYYEVRVERAHLDATGSPIVPRIMESGPVEAPRGGHGWFPRDALPPNLLTVGSGVRFMKEVFNVQDVEIFVRSFTDPPGYGYYVDGGFEEPQGRFTVIVNAQNGFLQAAVGPVEPITG